ncbi:MAG: hypothetical protein WDA25_08075, partial [Paracoccaceae bacterium]
REESLRLPFLQPRFLHIRDAQDRPVMSRAGGICSKRPRASRSVILKVSFPLPARCLVPD